MNPCSTSDTKREDPGAQTTDHGPQTPTPSTIDRSTNCRCLCSCRCDSGLWSIVNTNSSMETQEAAELPIVSRIRLLIVSDDCADGKILPSKHIHIVVLFGLLRNVRNTGLRVRGRTMNLRWQLPSGLCHPDPRNGANLKWRHARGVVQSGDRPRISGESHTSK